MHRTSRLTFLLLACALPASANVRLATIFTNDMMLQRDQPVRVWGWADPDEKVSVSLSGNSASSQAADDGAWAVELPALKSGENLELVVSGKNKLTLTNILVGDIWICSGQSNMEMRLAGCLGFQEDIAAADLPKIRRIKINRVQAGRPATDAPVAGPWQVCTPETAGGMTAVGFYFARDIVAKTGVPIGILDDNWGGTRIEPWTAPEGMAAVEALKADHEKVADGIKADEKNLAKDPAAPAPKPGGWNGMYNAMVHPIINLPIKGAIWYQGESNGGEGESYYHKTHALVKGWRSVWDQGDFPFYWVQLASYQDPTEDPTGGNGWAKLREAQTKALDIPNTGMAVITDTVPFAQRKDIHPKNKYDVGHRLALWALAKDYAQKDTPFSGPLFKELKVGGDKIRLTFDHADGGLMVGKKEGRTPAVEDKDATLKRFAIAGDDKKWHWADAVIDDNFVIVSSPEVKKPVAVRYGFEMNPEGANLYNRAGLPASPFRTDDW
ncbi:MAG: sialate O-acetylesterase [Verrucomicrobia bacterium]|nr:sialate O-acetylesterase [Verrucomicrobiota bacterium]